MNKEPVIFFDGVCGLCNGFVDFVIQVDKKQVFKFSPLQSDYAKANLPENDIKELKSVVLKKNGKTFRKSEAVFEVFETLGGTWRALSWLKILPQPLRNQGYDLVARYRYKIFGKKETCRLPTSEERQRFIL